MLRKLLMYYIFINIYRDNMIILFLKRLKHHSQWLVDLEKKELDKDSLDLLVNIHKKNE